MNLEEITKLFSSLSPLKIDNRLCTKVITPKSTCKKCIDICPNKSLSFVNGSWQIDDCLYCGLCVSACPNNVFKLEEDYLLNQCSPNNPLVLTCLPLSKEYRVQNNNIIKINCLAQLYPELVIKLLNNSQQAVIFLEKEKCADCLNFQIDKLIDESMQFHLPLDNLLITNNLKDLHPYIQTNTSKASQSTGQNNSRRMFFKSIFSGAKEVPQHLISSALDNLSIENNSNAKKEKVETRLPVSKREHISNSLKNIQSSVDNSQFLPYKKLEVDECNFCGACTKLCPTKALKVNKNEDTKKLTFYPQLCTECNICRDVCFFQGIKWGSNINIGEFLDSQPLEIVLATKKTCPNCGQDFWQAPDETELCMLCNR